jgi:hypothetical protein
VTDHQVLEKPRTTFETIVGCAGEVCCLLKKDCVFSKDLADVDGNALLFAKEV